VVLFLRIEIRPIIVRLGDLVYAYWDTWGLGDSGGSLSTRFAFLNNHPPGTIFVQIVTTNDLSVPPQIVSSDTTTSTTNDYIISTTAYSDRYVGIVLVSSTRGFELKEISVELEGNSTMSIGDTPQYETLDALCLNTVIPLKYRDQVFRKFVKEKYYHRTVKPSHYGARSNVHYMAAVPGNLGSCITDYRTNYVVVFRISTDYETGSIISGSTELFQFNALLNMNGVIWGTRLTRGEIPNAYNNASLQVLPAEKFERSAVKSMYDVVPLSHHQLDMPHRNSIRLDDVVQVLTIKTGNNGGDQDSVNSFELQSHFVLVYRSNVPLTNPIQSFDYAKGGYDQDLIKEKMTAVSQAPPMNGSHETFASKFVAGSSKALNYMSSTVKTIHDFYDRHSTLIDGAAEMAGVAALSLFA
jgi:hypothetical protein